MKRIILVSLILALVLILWGLKLSPQLSSSALEKAQSIPGLKTIVSALRPTPVKLPETMAQQKEKLDTMIAELSQLKANYNEELKIYKKADTEFTALVMKNRNNPNQDLIKAKQIELDAKFQDLSAVMKIYQEKSKAIYTFQSSTI